MSEELLIAQCAPTLADLKTGSLFTCPVDDPERLRESIRRYNAQLVPKGLCLLPMRIENGRMLLYLYRPSRLRRDLAQAQAAALLAKRHYPIGDPALCVTELVHRLQTDDAFPHEIGLFLGYPPEDVEGFILHRAQNARCVGTWKVYGDTDAAQRVFARYQKCTRSYQNAYQKHKCFSRLIVSEKNQNQKGILS